MEIRERTFQTDQIIQIAQNAERASNRLADDAFTQIEDLRNRLLQMDNKLASGKLQSTQRLLSDTSSSSTEG